jgi:hypothetical protein
MRRPLLRFASALALLVLLAPLALVACGTRTIDPAGDVLDGATVDAKADSAGDTPSTSYTSCGSFTGSETSCTLTTPGCCGGCGTPALGDYVAVASNKLSEYRTSVCPDPGAVACPGCAVQENPNFQAICRTGGCVAVDVSKDQLSACTTNADCQLRYAACCEPCDAPATGLIAIARSQSAAYAQAVCDPAADCMGCAGPVAYPSGKRAVCNATKHCSVL